MGLCYFDAHCDTILKIAENGGTLQTNPHQVSFDLLEGYYSAVQVFAIFNEGELGRADVMHLIRLVHRQAGAAFVRDGAALAQCRTRGGCGAMLSIEGLGNQPDFSVDDIDVYADEGVRIMSLTWNQDNPLCGGIGENRTGLTPLGVRALERMAARRMILDVSHCSERGFRDMAERWQYPLTATHSNARAVCNHLRNLTDEQLKTIFASGGVVGINLYPLFLNGSDTADVDHVVRHIEHMLSLGGENHIGLGADFDGIDHTVTDIDDSGQLGVLAERLLHLNHKESFIQKLFWANFDNLLKKYEFMK